MWMSRRVCGLLGNVNSSLGIDLVNLHSARLVEF